MERLKDGDIREALITTLNEKYFDDEETKIINEMGVLHGKSRVDLAVINGILHGYEIKSESDNLKRLPTQIKDYSLVFEKMTIVVQRNYLHEIRELIPKWWGIILVTRNKEQIKLKTLRKGKTNPNLDSFALSSLLWKEEAIEILKSRDLHRGYLSKPRREIYKRISDCLDLNEVKFQVTQQLKKREDWRYLQLQQSNGDLYLL